ncbi:MAG: TlyA family RNA methyltransferase [Dehalococcoidia bacterium]
MSAHGKKVRLDRAMVDRGLAESGEKARALVMAGAVSLPGHPGRGRPTPGMLVAGNQEIAVTSGPRFVSRGGEKLAHALDVFGLNPSGNLALDIGASTGGFTDCLLQAGASRVYAVDVGRGQLHNRLIRDERVVSMERVNARNHYEIGELVDLVVADVSFISLRLVLPRAIAHLRPGGAAVVLVKPQFEAEPGEVGSGGIIRDSQVHAAILGRFTQWAVSNGLRLRGLTSSPIRGDKGNREFLVQLEPARDGFASNL